MTLLGVLVRLSGAAYSRLKSDVLASLKQKTVKSTKPQKRKFGYAKGKITLSGDFDSPMSEFKDYM